MTRTPPSSTEFMKRLRKALKTPRLAKPLLTAPVGGFQRDSDQKWQCVPYALAAQLLEALVDHNDQLKKPIEFTEPEIRGLRRLYQWIAYNLELPEMQTNVSRADATRALCRANESLGEYYPDMLTSEASMSRMREEADERQRHLEYVMPKNILLPR